jgi:hypothetical protein
MTICQRALLALTLLASLGAADAQVTPQAYVKASNTGNGLALGDSFGWAMAAWGDTLVVGAHNEDSADAGVGGDGADDTLADAGAVYVFVRSGGTWVQEAYLKASTPGAGDHFGISVALWEDTLVVGATGEDSAATGVDGDDTDDGLESAGAAYVFVRSGGTWSQQAYLKASNPGSSDLFGFSVAAWGDVVAVGALGEDSSATGNDDAVPESGAAYTFRRSGTRWSPEALLKAGDVDTLDSFGWRLALSGDTLVVAAVAEDGSATGVDGVIDEGSPESGAVWVYAWDGAAWQHAAYVKASNTGSNDGFGYSITAHGDTFVVGAKGEDSTATGVDGNQSSNLSVNSGAAYVFRADGSSWVQEAYLKASNTGFLDGFGASVSLWDDHLVVGADSESSGATGVDGDQLDESSIASGAAYLFARTAGTWSQQAYLKASNTGQADWFGWSVAAMPQGVVVGAPSEDSDGVGVDGNQDNDRVPLAGAAYAFDVAPAECFLVIGPGPGDAGFIELDHLFQTQVGPVIEEAHPVLLDQLPQFTLPLGVTGGGAAGGVGGQLAGVGALRGGAPAGSDCPPWMLDGQFAVQVLMWNPGVFPGQPEQFTAGLLVTVLADGTVTSVPYGNDAGGMTVWHEVVTDATGHKVVRFPFAIPGM